MSHCSNADTLVAVGSALGWDVEDGLIHMASCERCRDQLRILGSLHALMDEEVPIRSEFRDRVFDALHAEAGMITDAARPIPPAENSWRLAALVLPLASLTAVLLLYLAMQVGAAQDAPAAVNIATAVVLGLLTAAWMYRRDRRTASASFSLVPD